MPFISFLQAGGAPSASSTESLISTIVPFVLIILIFYFFLIRPQNQKRKEVEKMIAALKKGDKVVTIGGIHGVVSSVKEKTVVLKVDDNAKIEFSRSAIASVETDGPMELKDGRAKEDKSKIEKKDAGELSAESENKQ